MKLRNTQFGAWLALIRIQGSPLTPIALLIGYATVAHDIITLHVVPLVIVGTVAQWGVYILNDVHDYEYDLDAKENDKPIVAGDIKIHNAIPVAISLLTFSLTITLVYFPLIVFILFMFALIIGFIYNARSKIDELRSLYMLVWGIFIIFTGAMYAGTFNIFTIITALFFGIYVMWIIWEDGLKDLGTGQPSIPERMNAHTYIKDENLMIFGSYQFALTAFVTLSIVGLLILSIPIIKYLYTYNNYWLIHTLLSVVLIYYMIITGFDLVYHGEFNRAEFKKDIAKHTSVAVITILFVSLTFTTLRSIVVMIFGSVIWGLLWTKIVYGEMFYFP